MSELSQFNVSTSAPHYRLLAESARFEGQMGAIAWAVLEMCRRGGMDQGALHHLEDQMMTYFARPSEEACSDILRVVEQRLEADRHWLSFSGL